MVGIMGVTITAAGMKVLTHVAHNNRDNRGALARGAAVAKLDRDGYVIKKADGWWLADIAKEVSEVKSILTVGVVEVTPIDATPAETIALLEDIAAQAVKPAGISDELAARVGTRWAKNGMVRYYLNDWPALLGLDIVRYGSGNISSATLNGRDISNSEAYRILGQVEKLYIEGGQVKARWGVAQGRTLSREDILARVSQAILAMDVPAQVPTPTVGDVADMVGNPWGPCGPCDGTDAPMAREAHPCGLMSRVAPDTPIPTLEDVAEMVGDPVGWVDRLIEAGGPAGWVDLPIDDTATADLAIPTNAPAIDGYEWQRYQCTPRDEITATSTYQLVTTGSVCTVVATVKYVKDGLWRASSCGWGSPGLTANYWGGESLSAAFDNVVTYMAFTRATRDAGIPGVEAARMDWRQGAAIVGNLIAPGSVVYRERDRAQGTIRSVLRARRQKNAPELHIAFPGGAGMIRTVAELYAEGFVLVAARGAGIPGSWEAEESSIWAGTGTLTQPIRTLLGRRKRKTTRRNRAAGLSRSGR